MSYKDVGLPTQATDLTADEVMDAVNPDPRLGYFHDPIPNNNEGWVPDQVQAALDAGEKPPRIMTEMVENPPAAAAKLSAFNTFVCDVQVNGADATMCGCVSTTQRGLRRHMRERHPGAIAHTSRAKMSEEERVAGLDAVKKWVISGRWRDARYAREPRVDERHFIKQITDAAEAIAASDTEFANTFGTKFNREPVDGQAPVRRAIGKTSGKGKAKARAIQKDVDDEVREKKVQEGSRSPMEKEADEEDAEDSNEREAEKDGVDEKEADEEEDSKQQPVEGSVM